MKSHSQKSHTKNPKITVILFHMDECGFCIELLDGTPSKWDKITKHIKTKIPDINIIKFERSEDPTKLKHLLTETEIENIKKNGFPTIVFVFGKTPILYDEKTRDLADFDNFLKKNNLIPNTKIGGKHTKKPRKTQRKKHSKKHSKKRNKTAKNKIELCKTAKNKIELCSVNDFTNPV
jgi:hypothetical protein